MIIGDRAKVNSKVNLKAVKSTEKTVTCLNADNRNCALVIATLASFLPPFMAS